MEICDFEPSTADDIKLVHDTKYVDSVLSLNIQNGFENKSKAIADALPWVCGSMVAATTHALFHNENTFSPTSGAHHAHYNYASGFCTFNFLVLAAVKCLGNGATKIGIIDCDRHYGDGTIDIIKRLSLEEQIQTYNYALLGNTFAREGDYWLENFHKYLWDFKYCDLIIYNAGADPHINDPLGGLLSTRQLFERDQIVFKVARDMGIPVVTSLAGGYQQDRDGNIDPVLEIHSNTLRACWGVIKKN